MSNEKDIPGLSYFDRAIGSLHGLPDVISTKATTLRVVPAFGLGSHTYIVQSWRQRESGDTVFLEVPYEEQTPFNCPCGYSGRIADLEIPDDDDEPMSCPQCGGHAWEWGIGETEAQEFMEGEAPRVKRRE